MFLVSCSCQCQPGLTETHYPPSQESLSGQSCVSAGCRGAFYCVQSFGRLEFWEGLFKMELFTFISPTTFSIRSGRLLSAHISIILVSHRRWNSLQSTIWMWIHPTLHSFLFACVSRRSPAHTHSCFSLCTFPKHALVFMKRCYFGVFAWSNKRQNSAVQSLF